MSCGRWVWRYVALVVQVLLFLSQPPQVHGIAARAPRQAQSFNSLKRSVLRITVFRRLFHWARPFDGHDVRGSLGSGFLVSIDPPTICTCAHVVTGADAVYVQVPEFGKTKFLALVATINHDADIAMVVLKDPDMVLDALKRDDVVLEPLSLASSTPPLGHSVVAPGFPLGQRTLTLSTGVISGVNHVDFHHRNLAIQSTAIISGGNSGSPLLDAETREVIGMNYAKQPGEAQINYVVPLWQLNQVIVKHDQAHKEANQTMPVFFRLVKPGLVTAPGQDALYLRSNGSQVCSSGPLISAILPESPFNDAVPAVRAESFLVSIDGVKLDRYGQGAKNEYVKELVDFDDLMRMRGGTGEQDIDFETCDAATGKVSKHQMSLAWRWEREGKGVRYVYEPRLEGIDWEIFGDLLFMDLTENHVHWLSGEFHSYALVRFLEPQEKQHPRLGVVLHREGGDAEEALGLHVDHNLAVVESVNGHRVNSLKELRQYYVPKTTGNKSNAATGNVSSGEGASNFAAVLSAERRLLSNGEDRLWSMRTAMGREYAALFKKTLASQAADAMAGASYLLTSAAEAALDQPAAARSTPEKAQPSMLAQGVLRTSRLTLRGPQVAAEEGAASQWSTGPLEVVQRSEDGASAEADIPPGESPDAW